LRVTAAAAGKTGAFFRLIEQVLGWQQQGFGDIQRAVQPACGAVAGCLLIGVALGLECKEPSGMGISDHGGGDRLLGWRSGSGIISALSSVKVSSPISPLR
jgi:hypothetical protein